MGFGDAAGSRDILQDDAEEFVSIVPVILRNRMADRHRTLAIEQDITSNPTKRGIDPVRNHTLDACVKLKSSDHELLKVRNNQEWQFF